MAGEGGNWRLRWPVGPISFSCCLVDLRVEPFCLVLIPPVFQVDLADELKRRNHFAACGVYDPKFWVPSRNQFQGDAL